MAVSLQTQTAMRLALQPDERMIEGMPLPEMVLEAIAPFIATRDGERFSPGVAFRERAIDVLTFLVRHRTAQIREYLGGLVRAGGDVVAGPPLQGEERARDTGEIELLLDLGMRVTNDMMLEAAARGHIAVMRVLLGHGGIATREVLNRAVEANQEEMVALLHEQRVRADRLTLRICFREVWDNNLMRMRFELFKEALFRRLLEAGVPPGELLELLRTFVNDRNREMVVFLLGHGAPRSQLMQEYARAGNIAGLNFLFQCTGAIELDDPAVLMAALEILRNREVIQDILGKGAPVMTVMLGLARAGNIPAMRVLLELGAIPRNPHDILRAAAEGEQIEFIRWWVGLREGLLRDPDALLEGAIRRFDGAERAVREIRTYLQMGGRVAPYLAAAFDRNEELFTLLANEGTDGPQALSELISKEPDRYLVLFPDYAQNAVHHFLLTKNDGFLPQLMSAPGLSMKARRLVLHWHFKRVRIDFERGNSRVFGEALRCFNQLRIGLTPSEFETFLSSLQGVSWIGKEAFFAEMIPVVEGQFAHQSDRVKGEVFAILLLSLQERSEEERRSLIPVLRTLKGRLTSEVDPNFHASMADILFHHLREGIWGAVPVEQINAFIRFAFQFAPGIGLRDWNQRLQTLIVDMGAFQGRDGKFAQLFRAQFAQLREVDEQREFFVQAFRTMFRDEGHELFRFLLGLAVERFDFQNDVTRAWWLRLLTQDEWNRTFARLQRENLRLFEQFLPIHGERNLDFLMEQMRIAVTERREGVIGLMAESFRRRVEVMNGWDRLRQLRVVLDPRDRVGDRPSLMVEAITAGNPVVARALVALYTPHLRAINRFDLQDDLNALQLRILRSVHPPEVKEGLIHALRPLNAKFITDSWWNEYVSSLFEVDGVLRIALRAGELRPVVALLEECFARPGLNRKNLNQLGPILGSAFVMSMQPGVDADGALRARLLALPLQGSMVKGALGSEASREGRAAALQAIYDGFVERQPPLTTLVSAAWHSLTFGYLSYFFAFVGQVIWRIVTLQV